MTSPKDIAVTVRFTQRDMKRVDRYLRKIKRDVPFLGPEPTRQAFIRAAVAWCLDHFDR